MASTPTLPLFDEPATPSTKRWPDDKRGSASDEERQAHVERLKSAGELTFGDPVADLRKPWWETLTEEEARANLVLRYREAHLFEDPTEDEAFWDANHTPADDRW